MTRQYRRLNRELWAVAILSLAMLACVAFGAIKGATKPPQRDEPTQGSTAPDEPWGSEDHFRAWIHTYSHADSPQGFHCWYEVNETQPNGVEKICASN